MTRPTTRSHTGASAAGSARAAALSPMAAAVSPRARCPGAASAHPKGVSPATRAAVRRPSRSMLSSRAPRLSREGARETRRIARTAITPARSRPRRDVETPAPMTTTRLSRTQVARAAGASARARSAAPHCPATAHTRTGRSSPAPVITPGTPVAAATASPMARGREGAVQAAMTLGSRVESTPVSMSGTRAQPRTVRAPAAARTGAAASAPRPPRPIAPATSARSSPSPYRAPTTVPMRAQTLALSELRVRRHLSRTRVATTTAPPWRPGRRRAG